MEQPLLLGIQRLSSVSWRHGLHPWKFSNKQLDSHLSEIIKDCCPGQRARERLRVLPLPHLSMNPSSPFFCTINWKEEACVAML